MVHKLAHVRDLESFAIPDPVTKKNLLEFLQTLDSEYGDSRNVEEDDGGYVLYCDPGTRPEELKALFDYSERTVEYVNRDLNASPPICNAMYLLNNEYAVVIVMSISDAPEEITEAFEEGY